jgi:hypothetical protein
VSQFQTRVAGCVSVQISAVIACDQVNRVPMVHGLLRSRWPPGGGQSERAVRARRAHPEKSLSSKHAVRYFLERKRRCRQIPASQPCPGERSPCGIPPARRAASKASGLQGSGYESLAPVAKPRERRPTRVAVREIRSASRSSALWQRAATRFAGAPGDSERKGGLEPTLGFEPRTCCLRTRWA